MTPKTTPPLLLGAHFSIAGGLDRAIASALEYNCTAFQLFTKNASTWKERILIDEETMRFKMALAEADISAVASHAAYLINVASPDAELRQRSITALAAELTRAHQLNIPMVVLHPGSHMGVGMATGIKRAAASIRTAIDVAKAPDTQLLIETTAGQGTGIGHRFEQIADILNRVDRKHQMGVCLDTCHVFAAGYDLRNHQGVATTIAELGSVVGLENLAFIHMNDALRPLGSKIDRHAHIGLGEIGTAGFAAIMTHPDLMGVPMILETPKGDRNGPDWDRRNLRQLRKLAANR